MLEILKSIIEGDGSFKFRVPRKEVDILLV